MSTVAQQNITEGGAIDYLGTDPTRREAETGAGVPNRCVLPARQADEHNPPRPAEWLGWVRISLGSPIHCVDQLRDVYTKGASIRDYLQS